jgi:FKBP-type peptidyl-prolyl cis-trans isomerase SlyD
MPNRVISFHYTLKDDQGQTLDSSAGHDPLAFLEGKGQIIPKLEEQLGSMNVGEKKQVLVGHKDAYGAHDEKLIRSIPIKNVPKKDVKVGDEFEVTAGGKRTLARVTEVTTEQVTLDGNHPLAGKDLSFDVELVEVREASAEELSHGHVHGPGGAHH